MLSPDQPGADEQSEVLHMWRLQDVEFGEHGTTTRYRCDLHPLEVLVVGPGQAHPPEV